MTPEQKKKIYEAVRSVVDLVTWGNDVEVDEGNFEDVVDEELIAVIEAEDGEKMDKPKRRKLYTEALTLWGLNSQVMMVFEETAELQNALAKYFRGRTTDDDVITELADVSIMVEQMAYCFGEEKFQAERERKLLRLQERVNNVKEKMPKKI